MGQPAEAVIDAAFRKAQANHAKLWGQNSAHIPTRQAKFEEFCLYLAATLPPVSQPKARRAVLEAAIERLDIGLREAGVGDTSFSREIRTIAAALHGRLQAYEKFIISQDLAALQRVALSHGIAPRTLQAVIAEFTPLTPLPKAAKAVKGRSIRQKLPKRT
jgi:hypothetical protein